MKKFILIFAFLFSTALVFSQGPYGDTSTVRSAINTQIVPNGTKQITALQLNYILNGLLNTYPINFVDTMYASAGNFYWRRSGVLRNFNINSMVTFDTTFLSTRAWRQKGIDSSLAYVASTYVPKSRTITIDNVTYDLSANRTWNIIPSQTGNSGKYLTTNGSSTSWSTIDLSSYLTSATAASTYVAQTRTLNGLPWSANQTFATASSGNDFSISSSGTVHTFNIPSASATARGLITTGTQTIAGDKTFSGNVFISGLTSGRVPLITTSGQLTSTANFTWSTRSVNFGPNPLRWGSSDNGYPTLTYNGIAPATESSGYTYAFTNEYAYQLHFGGSNGQKLSLRVAPFGTAGNVITWTEAVTFHNATGNASFGANTDVASAQVSIVSTTKGFLPPKMTATQVEAISSPAEGLLVYSTNGTGIIVTSKGWWGYDGTTWVKLN